MRTKSSRAVLGRLKDGHEAALTSAFCATAGVTMGNIIETLFAKDFTVNKRSAMGCEYVVDCGCYSSVL